MSYLFVLVVWCCVLSTGALHAEATYSIEFMLPMRDGVLLHTVVELPTNDTAIRRTAVYERSPYGENATEKLAETGLPYGLAAVKQDMRGSAQSQGFFQLWGDGDDAYDTMQWVANQSWSNGKVIGLGASADALASLASMQTNPPWLVGQFLIVGTGFLYPFIYPGGAFNYDLMTGWLNQTFLPTDAAKLLQEYYDNEAPTPWWDRLNISQAIDNVRWNSVFYGGWYDILIQGTIDSWRSYQTQANPAWRGHAKLMIDPYGHCNSIMASFPSNSHTVLILDLAYDMFTNSSAKSQNTKAVTFYVMGSLDPDAAGSFWTTLDDFPEYAPTSLYLTSAGTLSPMPASTGAVNRSFLFDPDDPVPTIGGNNLWLPCGPLDQRSIESRPDVLVFDSAVLTEPLFIVGPLEVVLYVSTNATDTDFTAKLTDVYPNGTSLLIQDGITRCRWRELPNPVPQPMQPGTIYEISVSLFTVASAFSAQHRLRLAVSSSNFPRFDVNPNNGVPLNQRGAPLVAENTVWMSAQYPSRVILPLVKEASMPKVVIH